MGNEFDLTALSNMFTEFAKKIATFINYLVDFVNRSWKNVEYDRTTPWETTTAAE